MDTPQATPHPTPPTAAELQQLADLMRKFPGLFPAPDARSQATVAQVVDRYLANAQDEVSPRVYEDRRRDLLAFRATLGERLVSDCTPLDLKEWLAARADRLKSGNARARVNASVQRAFNWGAVYRVCRENPFRGLKATWEKRVGRDMKLGEFQALLRFADPYYRRFLVTMKLTGARPCELRELRWSHVNWSSGIATLPFGKTVKKTGKPRRLVLVPQVLKMLRVIRRDQHGQAAVELRRILAHAPGRCVPGKQVVATLRGLGFSYRAIYAARKAIGATYRRVGGWAEHGHCVYELPEEAAKRAPPEEDHVFYCGKRRPWTRYGLAVTFLRLRRRIGLPASCKLYGIRHLFCTWAVKRGLNLKVIATLLGHTTTAMVERIYTHIDGDFAYLQEAAQIATMLHAEARQLPAPAHAAALAEARSGQYPRAQPRPRRPAKPEVPARLLTAHRDAYRAWKFAVGAVPGLARAGAVRVYEWLRGRPRFAGALPPSAASWRRYLHIARTYYQRAAERDRPLPAATPGSGTAA